MDPRFPLDNNSSGKPIAWVTNNKWTRTFLPVRPPVRPPTPVLRNRAVDRIPSKIWNLIFLYATVRHGGKRPVICYRPAIYDIEEKTEVGISENRTKIEEFECVNDVSVLRSICGVCRLWRATAVNSQLLWNYVRSDFPMHFVMKMFQRSGDQPLYADIEISNKLQNQNAECIQEILSRLSRVKTFKFYASNSALFSRYFDWLEQCPAPELENLALTSRPQAVSVLGQLPDVTILPKNAFKACASLRVLLLENVAIPIDSHILYTANLRELYIRFIPFHLQLSLSELLVILGHIDQLEVLELISAGPKNIFVDGRLSETRIRLPKLQRMSMQGVSSIVAQKFMSYICTPSLMFLDVRHEGACQSRASFLIPRNFALPLTVFSTALELNVAVVPGQMNLSVYSVNGLDFNPMLVCQLTYKHGNCATLDAEVPILLSALKEMHCAENVVSLHIDINQGNLRQDCHISPALLHHLLRAMPRVKLLRFVPAGLKSLSAAHCLASLCSLRGHLSVGNNGVFVGTIAHALSLRTVVFEGVSWDEMDVVALMEWLRFRLFTQRVILDHLCFVRPEGFPVRAAQVLSGIVDCHFYP